VLKFSTPHKRLRNRVLWCWDPYKSAFSKLFFRKVTTDPHIPPPFFCGAATRVRAFSFLRLLDYAQRRTTVGRVISSSQRPLPDNTQHSQQTNIHAPVGIRTHDLSRRAAADLRLRPRSHWSRSSHPYVHLERSENRYSKLTIYVS
jgi:hypothetical protein